MPVEMKGRHYAGADDVPQMLSTWICPSCHQTNPGSPPLEGCPQCGWGRATPTVLPVDTATSAATPPPPVGSPRVDDTTTDVLPEVEVFAQVIVNGRELDDREVRTLAMALDLYQPQAGDYVGASLSVLGSEQTQVLMDELLTHPPNGQEPPHRPPPPAPKILLEAIRMYYLELGKALQALGVVLE